MTNQDDNQVPDPAVRDPETSAQSVGLSYVNDEMTGIWRLKAGKIVCYVDEAGKAVRDTHHLDRIESLGIPPAWKDVWICPFEDGHLQATGHDERGRKQHLYHSRWREVRDEVKFNRLIPFARSLPRIRRRIRKDMALPGLCRDKVLATVVRLLEVSLIRVGNQEYARDNQSFGLTTLRDSHVNFSGSSMRFQFRGKSGKQHIVDVNDRRLARIVKNCQAIPGQHLFQFLDERQQRHGINSDDVNDYLKEISGQDFTAKDFRTWAGTVLVAQSLVELEPFGSWAQAKNNMALAIKHAAKRLGNTAAICRKCYVHPAVFDAYLDRTLTASLLSRADTASPAARHGLRREEEAVLTLLRRYALTGSRRKGRRRVR